MCSSDLYKVEWRVLVAADYGAPTIRKRLYLIARCDGKPIVWPEPTHARNPGADLWTMGCKKWRGAHECIDWSLPCPSIFERKKPLAENTERRVAEGIRRYVIDCAEPFIVAIDNQSSGAGAVWSTADPLRTVTAENRFALVSPYIVKPNHGYDYFRGQSVEEPLATQTQENQFALAVPHLVQTGYGEREGQAPRVMSVESPLGTIVGTGKHALCAAFLAKHGIEQGSATDHRGEVCAFLTKYYGTGNGSSLKEPMGTVTSKDRMGLVYVYGHLWQIWDIGLRMLQPRELARAQGFPDTYILTGTKTSQVARIGNSVCPDMAEALVRANFPAAAECRRAA